MPSIAAAESLIRSMTIPWGSKSTALERGLASNTEVVMMRGHKQGLYLFKSPGNPQWQARAAGASAQRGGAVRVVGELCCKRVPCGSTL